MIFIGWIIQIVLGLLGLKKPPGPSQEAQAVGRAAAAETVAAIDKGAAKTQAAVAQAEADAPKTDAELDAQLRKGAF